MRLNQEDIHGILFLAVLRLLSEGVVKTYMGGMARESTFAKEGLLLL